MADNDDDQVSNYYNYNDQASYYYDQYDGSGQYHYLTSNYHHEGMDLHNHRQYDDDGATYDFYADRYKHYSDREFFYHLPYYDITPYRLCWDRYFHFLADEYDEYEFEAARSEYLAATNR